MKSRKQPKKLFLSTLKSLKKPRKIKLYNKVDGPQKYIYQSLVGHRVSNVENHWSRWPTSMPTL